MNNRRFGVLEVLFVLIALGYVGFALFRGDNDNANRADSVSIVEEATARPTAAVTTATPDSRLNFLDDMDATISPGFQLERGVLRANAGDYGAALADHTDVIDRTRTLIQQAEAELPPTIVWVATEAAGGRPNRVLNQNRAIQVSALLYRGDVYMELGDYQQALDDYVAIAYDGNVNLDELLAKKGMARYELGLPASARNDFAQSLEENSENALANYGMGRILMDEGDAEAALDHFHAAVRADNTVLAYHLADAEAHVALGQYDLALTTYEIALNVDPNSAAARYGAADAALQLGQPQLAIDQLTALIRSGDATADAYRRRGDTHLQLFQYSPAIADYSVALSMGGENADALIGRGVARRNVEELSAAVDDLTVAVSLEPENATIYMELGQTYLALGDTALAERDLTRATQLDPGNPLAWAYLGDLYAATDRPEEAAAAYEIHVGRASATGEDAFIRALEYLDTGRTARTLQGIRDVDAPPVPTETPAPDTLGTRDTAFSVTLRTEPSVLSDPLDEIPAGVTITLLDRISDDTGITWFRISHDNTQGWVPSIALEPLASD